MGVKILLADDSITIQKVVGLTLKDTPYELLSVSNGTEAVEKTLQFKPDLLIVDVSMPGKTGYEVCREIKSNPQFRNTPVILMHGTFEAFDEKLAKEVGADGILTKPFESKLLLQTIENCLKKKEIPAQAPQEEEGVLLEEEVEELTDTQIVGTPEKEEGEVLGEAEIVEGEIAEAQEEILEAEPVEEGLIVEEEPVSAEIEGEVEKVETPEEAIPLEEEPQPEEAIPLAEERAEVQAEPAEELFKDEGEFSGFEEPPVEKEAAPFDEVISLYEESPQEKEEAIGEISSPEEEIPLEVSEEIVPEEKIEPASPPVAVELGEGLELPSEEKVRKALLEIAEKIAWDIIPDLVEMIVKKELDKRLGK